MVVVKYRHASSCLRRRWPFTTPNTIVTRDAAWRLPGVPRAAAATHNAAYLIISLRRGAGCTRTRCTRAPALAQPLSSINGEDDAGVDVAAKYVAVNIITTLNGGGAPLPTAVAAARSTVAAASLSPSMPIRLMDLLNMCLAGRLVLITAYFICRTTACVPFDSYGMPRCIYCYTTCLTFTLVLLRDANHTRTLRIVACAPA